MLNSISVSTAAQGVRIIGQDHEPFVIAEMSGNHNQSLERALAIVDAAADAGADALKLQTYTPDTLTIPGVGKIQDPSSLWSGKTLYELYQEAYTPWEWHEAIFARARQRGMIPFSTPFDHTAVSFLENLGVSLYKIASFENADWELLRCVARTGKPIIMSTGASTISELAESVGVLRDAGAKEIVLLKCTSSYPAVPVDSHIRTIPHMRELFGTLVGLSDHTGGCGAAVASVALGASVIEKHFTLSRAEGGVDAAFSLEPHEFKTLKQETTRAWQSLGSVSYTITASESKNLVFKRSLYIVKDVAAGETLTESHVRVIRPGDGLPPKYYRDVLGRVTRRALSRGTPLTWEALV